MAKRKKEKPEAKHPKDMTTEEAIEHLFSRKGKDRIKKHVEKVDRSNTKKE